MEWLHANGKLIIIGPFNHTKPYTVAYLDTKIYFNFSLVLEIEFGRNGRHAVLQLVGDCLQQVAGII